MQFPFSLAEDLGGSVPVLVPVPVPGDPNYVDHVASALARLVEQFKAKNENDAAVGANNISLLLAALCSAGVQPIENTLQQVLTQRTLDTAIGAQLDVIGKIVGQLRGGLDDDTYRQYLRAAITANNSGGTVADLIRVLDLVLLDQDAVFVVMPQPVATVHVLVDDVAITTELANTAFLFLARAAAAGVRVMLDYGTSPSAEWFRFDSGPGYDQGHFIGRIE
jgi:hypothetical protein